MRDVWLDDALLDQYVTVFPILKKYGICERGIKVIIGVVTGCVGKTFSWTDPYVELPCMNIVQLKEMIAYGCKIATHSVTHPSFKHLSKEEVTYELAESTKWIRDNLGVSPIAFVPPYDDLPYLEQQVIIKRYVPHIRQPHQVRGKSTFSVASRDYSLQMQRMGRPDLIMHMLTDDKNHKLSAQWGKFYFPIERLKFEINLMELIKEADKEKVSPQS